MSSKRKKAAALHGCLDLQDGIKPGLSQTFRSLNITNKPLKKTLHCKRRSSDTDRESPAVRRKPRCKSLGPPKCAQQFYLSPLAHSSTYLSYGSTSDKPCELPYKKPDPYRELHNEVMTVLRKTLQKQASSLPSYKLDLPEDLEALNTCFESTLTGKEGLESAKGECQYDEEEDEEEDGIPQAVRATLPHQEPTTSAEILKALHLQHMEKMVRGVSPSKLVTHLNTTGYLNHQYDLHMRTSLDQQNLKSGMKKGVERLYSILPTYTI